MDDTSSTSWSDPNKKHLISAIAELKGLLRRFAQPAKEPAAPSHPVEVPSQSAELPPLEIISHAFMLTRFERDVLLLCAAAELDQEIPVLCGMLQNNPARDYPTFGVAMMVFPDSHWSALIPSSPLRRWRLVELAGEPILTAARLRIDERIMHFLAGMTEMDEQIVSYVRVLAPVHPGDLVASHEAIVERILTSWSGVPLDGKAPVIQLCGDLADCRPLAAAAAQMLHQKAVTVAADLVPNMVGEFEFFIRLLERETYLAGSCVLVLEAEESEAGLADARPPQLALSRMAERFKGLVILCERQRRRLTQRSSIMIDVDHPLLTEQRQAWRKALDVTDDEQGRLVDGVCVQFNLSLTTIQAIAIEAKSHAQTNGDVGAVSAIWGMCRQRLRARLDAQAQRIDALNSWEDLILPDSEASTLKLIVAQIRQRLVVYEDWGFAAKSARGLGVSALFAGPSGTGKTLAAEVLANELGLDLYRIDLASVISKYIGETEKNLRRVFDAAEESGAVLLFDEADALFGKRSEVKDSHDRYANVEVSYLLQRMEAYRGLAILTTNMKSALDTAFLRRLRFIVQFPFPGLPQRTAIWARAFPPATPTDGIKPAQLAKMRIAGGNIRNIAMNAAFLAADAREPVRMCHVRAAALGEYAKLERSLSPAEFEGWDG